MCDNLHLDSLQQCETPLNTLFFSDFNKNLIQRGIRQAFRDKTGIAIDVKEQVKKINTRVIITALSQIQTGVSQFIAYNRDIETISVPLDQPINTSTVGKKMDFNDKIGFN
jgi:hypothetical protein